MATLFQKIKDKRELKKANAIKAREEDIRQKMQTDPEYRKWMEEQEERKREEREAEKRERRAIEFQKSIMDGLICPLCNNDKFISARISKSKDAIDYEWSIESLKICRRCGFMIRYYDFDRDKMDTGNFDEEDGAVYLKKVRHN